MRYTLAGVSREAFAAPPLPAAVPLFELTFRDARVVRLDDVRAPDASVDGAPSPGWPPPHLAVRSYLAVPVVRSQQVLGGLFLGHAAPARFSERHARLLGRMAAQAAIALDNARHYHAAEAARDAAEASNRAKDEFLAMLAHELRNPLGVILNGLKILDRVGQHDDEPSRIRALMTRQTEHLARLLDDLLDLARISQGRVELRKEPLDLRTVVDFAVESERHRLAAKAQALDIAMPPAPVMVYADQARMQQVVGNLIHNASKYTPERGRVSVKVEPAGDEARVHVRDTGVGVPREKLAAIFDLFVQLDASPDRAQGGLGIGLTLVRRLVEQHGGSVRAESEGAGQGTEFIVTLPLTSAAPLSPPASERPSSPRRLQILLIEDNADAREMLQFGLTLAGHQVQTAADGDAGIAFAIASPPDVAIVDLGLPRVDGLGVARALRAKLGPAIRLVALTGYGQQADRERTRAAGFDAHVTKPATVEDVLAALPS
jgi:signal transduction histidine kinase/CheY-like chemotaxis protein